jgi:hypothetical protein
MFALIFFDSLKSIESYLKTLYLTYFPVFF